MFITVICDEEVAYIEVFPDLELENFIALCYIYIPHLSPFPSSNLRFFFNGISVTPNKRNIKEKLQTFNINDGDIINIKTYDGLSNFPQSSGSHQGINQDLNALVSSLVKGIKVPGKNATKDEKDRQISLKIFNSLKEPGKLASLRAFSTVLADAYEANPESFEYFHRAFLDHKREQERRIKLMHDETSEEGQRYIADLIAKENIDFSHQFALEHMPEAFIPVHMLYIHMKINGQSVIAFVDSGAQVSILSESCAKRCNISRLIDNRFRATALGVGGSQKFLGRIHSFSGQVQVEGHIFPCPFDVMAERNIDILFGLNMLRRHQCSVDLQKNVLCFGDGTETPFLTEEEYRRETEVIEGKDIVQSEK